MMSPLVYDIGVHDGSDTGHYLREGARVVAVDANPVMCAAVEANFRDYIRTGQLQVINRGIAEHNGQLEFWVCDDVSDWSSFHRDIASRNGAKHHAIIVDCIRISDIVDEFGVADYMKIDIEGNDRVCIVDLTSATVPKYISIEMDHSHGDQDIKRLFELGYRAFKVICQNDSWHQVTTRNLTFYDPVTHKPFILRCWRKVRRVSTRWLSGRRIGESGPWGEKTSGSWQSVDHALSVWRFLHEIDERHGTLGLGHWYDIHARK